MGVVGVDRGVVDELVELVGCDETVEGIDLPEYILYASGVIILKEQLFDGSI